MTRLPPTCLLVLLLICAPAAKTQAGEPSEFSGADLAVVRSLGPWPARFQPDPSNRVSGQPLAIELGRRLFLDPRMSPIGYIACVTCHQPDRSFTDLKARAHGLADLPRNTMALANLRLQRWYGWGGSSDSLWMASLRPMLDAREFDSQPAIVARVYRRDEELALCYLAVFKTAPSGPAERVMVNTGKALAAYLETLVTERTAFDEFRDALEQGDAAASARYPAAARRGLKLFVGALGCVECHAGPNFSDGRFHRDPTGAALAGADLGRYSGVREWRGSRFNLSGAYNDNPARAAPMRTAGIDEHTRAAFRTPSLRNVAVTAPYLHDGRHDGLREASLHRWRGADATASAVQPPTAAQADDLQAFLASLTDRHGARRPPSVVPIACP